MKKERFEALKEIIGKDRWKIDAKEGIVQGRHGSQGHIDEFGYRRLTGRHNNKTYVFGTHEIIAAYAGYDLTDKEVAFIDGDRQNTRLDNIEVCNVGHASMVVKRVGLRRKNFTDDEIREIRQCFENGEKTANVAKAYNATYKTIARIRQGVTYQHVE